MQFAQYATEWLDRKVMTGALARRSLATYESLLTRLVSALGSHDLSAIGSQQINQTLSAWAKEGLSDKTRRSLYDLLRQILRSAMTDGQLSTDPTLTVKPPAVSWRRSARRRKGLFREDVDALLEAAKDDPAGPIIRFCLKMGVRRIEVSYLKWTDFDWLRSTVVINRSKTLAGEERVIGMPSDIAAEFKAMWQSSPDKGGWVFSNSTGGRRSEDVIAHQVTRVFRKAGIQGSMHSLRHSHISFLFAKNAPLTAISRRAGHASPRVTMEIYAHAIDRSDEGLVALLEDD